MPRPCAAVDVGSNSVRLLVADGSGQRLTRVMEITRLAAGVDATGHLDDAALARTLDTIGRFRELWTGYGVTDLVRIAATSAVRDAQDRERFFAGVRTVSGVEAEVLTGEQEAALAFAGAAAAVEVSRPTAVVDIGGGSTELVVGDADGRVAGSVSLQLGCVRVTERHLADDPPSAAQLIAATAMVTDRLDHAERTLAEQGVALDEVAGLVGVAGTATTLGAIHLGLAHYDEDRIHGARLPLVALEAITADLLARTARQRASLGPVQPGREDVLHGGALVLLETMRRLGVDEVVISEADNLDGLVASLT